ncbi:hypothetical protein Leryth_016951, partial [Lithospermum erythrorhizon]
AKATAEPARGFESFVPRAVSKSFRSSLERIAMCCTIYHIWLERNMRTFAEKQQTRDQLIICICSTVMDKTISWRKVKKNKSNYEL